MIIRKNIYVFVWVSMRFIDILTKIAVFCRKASLENTKKTHNVRKSSSIDKMIKIVDKWLHSLIQSMLHNPWIARRMCLKMCTDLLQLYVYEIKW